MGLVVHLKVVILEEWAACIKNIKFLAGQLLWPATTEIGK